jgi:hypothetical protein
MNQRWKKCQTEKYFCGMSSGGVGIHRGERRCGNLNLCPSLKMPIFEKMPKNEGGWAWSSQSQNPRVLALVPMHLSTWPYIFDLTITKIFSDFYVTITTQMAFYFGKRGRFQKERFNDTVV